MDHSDLTTISVGLGELYVSRDPRTVLVAHGLGSCVGVCAYDPIAGVAAMLHAMLPQADGRGHSRPTRYVDTGIKQMMAEMHEMGALRMRSLFRIAGGAQMLNAPGIKNTLNIGARNIESARTMLSREGLELVGDDTGGTRGRTVKFYVASGLLTVRSVGKGERELPLPQKVATLQR